MFSFTFLQILFYEPIACYLPDTEAAPQGIIFSPLSQRVASLMLGLKSLEQLHIGYLYRVSPGQSVQVRKVPCMDQTGILGAAFFCFAPPPPETKRGITLIYLKWDMSLSIWDQYVRIFSTYSKGVNFSGKSRHNPDFLNPDQMRLENLQDLLKSKKKMSLEREYSQSPHQWL